jgi:hypothetical protein
MERVMGIEPNEHQIPRFQGFSRQIIGFTAKPWSAHDVSWGGFGNP